MTLDEDVLRLNITMSDRDSVKVLQRIGEAAEEGPEEGQRVWVIVCLRIVVRQFIIANWLHDYCEVTGVSIACYLSFVMWC